MQIEYNYGQWDDKQIRQLFGVPEGSNEHHTTAITHHIDLLLESHTEPEGYKKIVLGWDEYNNCTERDKIKLNDKCIYLITALSNAFKHYPEETSEAMLWGCKCIICSIIANPIVGKTIEEWWIAFH